MLNQSHCYLLAALFTAGAATACNKSAAVPAPASEPYVIGFGEIMGLTQMRHAKLWFAGQAQNWPLAAYEIDELNEGFADAMKFHPQHKSVPMPLAQMFPQFIDAPIAALNAAVAAQDAGKFVAAFDQLTSGCNSCHRAANFGFNVVTRPTAPPYSNQDFAVAPAIK